jgi:CBS domain-containing protein
VIHNLKHVSRNLQCKKGNREKSEAWGGKRGDTMTVQLLVKDVMAKPVTISKSQSVNEALDKMLNENIDPLIVLASHQVVGTVSRKSIADKLGSKNRAPISTAKIHVASSLEENIPSVFPQQEISDVIPFLKQYKLVVVHDNDKRLIGQVGYGEVLRVLQPKGSIEEAMEPAHTIDANERLSHLQVRMAEHNISRFVVTEGEKISGIVTETDLAISLRKFREKVEDRHQDFRFHNILIRTIMTTPILTIDRSAKIPDVVGMMLKKNISSVPVVDKGNLVGIITRRSLVNAL